VDVDDERKPPHQLRHSALAFYYSKFCWPERSVSLLKATDMYRIRIHI